MHVLNPHEGVNGIAFSDRFAESYTGQVENSSRCVESTFIRHGWPFAVQSSATLGWISPQMVAFVAAARDVLTGIAPPKNNIDYDRAMLLDHLVHACEESVARGGATIDVDPRSGPPSPPPPPLFALALALTSLYSRVQSRIANCGPRDAVAALAPAVRRGRGFPLSLRRRRGEAAFAAAQRGARFAACGEGAANVRKKIRTTTAFARCEHCLAVLQIGTTRPVRRTCVSTTGRCGSSRASSTCRGCAPSTVGQGGWARSRWRRGTPSSSSRGWCGDVAET